MLRQCLVFLLAAAIRLSDAQIVLFNSTAAIASTEALSTACQIAMMANITCPASLFNLASAGDLVVTSSPTISTVCASNCLGSLASYHNNVATACSKDPFPWVGVPATWAGDVMWAFANRTCAKNTTTGKYCVDEVLGWWATLNTTDVLLSSLPKQYLCTPCMISLLSQSQSTAFSNYGAAFVSDWQAVQTACNVKYPVAVLPSSSNVTESGLPNYYSISNLTPVPCISGKTYTAIAGDTCISIAKAKNVASGSLSILNSLYADCSSLKVRQSLCLPSTCTTYLVQKTDTCASVAAAQKAAVYQLQSWNPALNIACTNLLAGSYICVSSPGGVWKGTTISGFDATPSTTKASSTTTATTTSSLTGIVIPVPHQPLMVASCTKFFFTVLGDTCAGIASKSAITLTQFYGWNPDVGTNCANLWASEWYCVSAPPVATTSQSTPTSTAVATPTPHQPNMVGGCKNFYFAVGGDTCQGIATKYATSLTNFYAWNPDVGTTCANLWGSEWYCVGL